MTTETKWIWGVTGCLALALFGGGPVGAQYGPSVTPSPPVSSQERAQVFEVDGIKIIFCRDVTRPIVAVNLYLLGGTRQITENTAGIEPLLLEASERGTRNYPGFAAQQALVRTGSQVEVSAQPDWTIFGFRGLAEQFDSTWAVFADRLMFPSLTPAAVEVARSRRLAIARATEDDPDLIARSLAESRAFTGHSYALDVNGTGTSLAEITAEDLRDYATRQIITSRMLLAVVGDVAREQVRSAVARTIGQLPRGDYVWGQPPTWAADEPSVRVRHQGLPTNYIVGYFGGPQASDDDYLAFTVATAFLSGTVFNWIRDLGISYSAGAYVVDRGAAGGALYVTTTEPLRAITVVNRVIDVLQNQRLERTVLRDVAEGEKWGYYLATETNAGLAGFLARIYLRRGDVLTPEQVVEEMARVSPGDVRSATRRYIKNIQYAFLGDQFAVPHDAMREH